MKKSFLSGARFFFLLGFFQLFSPAWALDLAPSVAAVHLPAAHYHYLGVQADLRFALDGDRDLGVQLGVTPPHTVQGYSQFLLFLSVQHEWKRYYTDWFMAFYGTGGGIYFDKVADQLGWVPAWVNRAGTRFQLGPVGLELGTTIYLGSFSPLQVFWFTVWPLTVLNAGLYVEF